MMTLKEAYDRIERRIEERYGIPVIMSDVLDPNTGDFDGVRILVDHDQELESALFVMTHLFGHTVQWNTSEEYRKIGIDVAPGKTDDQLRLFYDYEKNAARYSLQLMHDSGVTELDQHLSDWWHADWKYLEHFYRTGEKLDFSTLFRRDAGELLTPLPIPEFQPQKWVSRWSF